MKTLKIHKSDRQKKNDARISIAKRLASSFAIFSAILFVLASCPSTTSSGSTPSQSAQGSAPAYHAGNSGGQDTQAPSDNGAYKTGGKAIVKGRGNLPADIAAGDSTAGKYFIGWSKTDVVSTDDTFEKLVAKAVYIPGEQITIGEAKDLYAIYVTRNSASDTNKVFSISANANAPASVTVHGTFMAYPSAPAQMVAGGQLLHPYIPDGYQIDGNVLKGWSFSATGTPLTAPIVVPTAATGPSITVYAIWEADSAANKITYNWNDTSTSTNAVQSRAAYSRGNSVTMPSPDEVKSYPTVPVTWPIPSGKVFAGWATSSAPSEGIPDYQIGDTYIMPATAPTFYAIWADSANAISVTYLKNAPARSDVIATVTATDFVAPAVSSYNYVTGQKITLAAATLAANATWQGDFVGWNTKADGSGTAFIVGQNTVPVISESPKVFTLYAKWTERAAVTISYNPVSSTGTGSGTLSGTPTLKAYVSTASKTNKFNLPPSTGFTAPSGQTFIGWGTTAATAISGALSANSEYTCPTSNSATSITFYAVWGQPPVIKIIFSMNGGTGTAPAEVNLTWPNPITLPAGTGIASPDSNKLFGGWSISDTGTAIADTNAVTAGIQWLPDAVPSTDELTLYAVWSSPVVSLTYNLNGGSGIVPTSPSSYTWISSTSPGATMPSGNGMISPEPANKIFAGWSTVESTETNFNVYPGVVGASWKPAAMPTSLSSSQTFYAIWILPWIYIEFNLNGGTGTAPTILPDQWPYHFTLPELGEANFPAGKYFIGWALSKADADDGNLVSDMIPGAGLQWRPATLPTSPDFHISLWAAWTSTPPTISLSYNLNGGSGTTPTTPALFTWPTPVTLPDNTGLTPPNTDKLFAGWALSQADATAGIVVPDQSDAVGLQWKPSSPPSTPTSTQVFYAVWKYPVVQLSYNLQGGTGTAPTTPASLVWPTAVTLPGSSAVPDQPYSLFNGWAISLEEATRGNTIVGASGGSWKPLVKPATLTSAQVFYAVWKIPQVTITYDINGGGGTAPNPVTTIWSDSVTLPEIGDMTAPTGKVFLGWAASTNDANNGNVVTDLEDTTEGVQWRAATTKPTTLTVAKTLHASWISQIEVNITYSANGGTGVAPSAASLIWPSYATLPPVGSMIAPTGKYFGGWALTSAGSAVVDLDATEDGIQWRPATRPSTATSSQILYAVWTTTFRVAFVLGPGGTGTPPVVNPVTLGNSFTIPGQGAVSRPGYNFSGWALAASGDGSEALSGTYTAPSYPADGILKLYAVWDGIDYSVSMWSGEGGDWGKSYSKYPNGIALKIIIPHVPPAAHPTYVFKYFVNAEFGRYAADDTFVPPAYMLSAGTVEFDFTAVWEAP